MPIGSSWKIALYEKINAKIEKMCKVIHFIVFKLTCCGAVMSAVTMTAVNHFVYDLGDDSYVLPIFAM